MWCAVSVASAATAYCHVQPQQPQPENSPSGYTGIPAGFDFPADRTTLEYYRATSNFSAQRQHAWRVFAGLTQASPDNGLPIFDTWYSEDETFRASHAPQSLAPRPAAYHFRAEEFHAGLGAAAARGANPAPLSLVLYNRAAYQHIRANELYAAAQLQRLRANGAADISVPGDRTIPDFPAAAVSVKTIWWPVAKDGTTALPVWDPALSPPHAQGNDYTSWARVVGVEPHRGKVPSSATRDLVFMGHAFAQVRRVGLADFYYLIVDRAMASSVMSTPKTARVARLVLGRPLQPGDYLVLVAMHVSTKEIEDWVWATFWWHDRPDDGPFATGRPDLIKGAWRNYLMNVSYDVNLPREPDGAPHIAFNPWVEGKFPAQPGGQGSGMLSNCMNCHSRASYPKLGFLPIRRGNPDLQGDPAFAAGRLRTDFLWSIPDKAK